MRSIRLQGGTRDRQARGIRQTKSSDDSKCLLLNQPLILIVCLSAIKPQLPPSVVHLEPLLLVNRPKCVTTVSLSPRSSNPIITPQKVTHHLKNNLNHQAA